jgi:hypothetical protein
MKMNNKEEYDKKAALVIEILPFIREQEIFDKKFVGMETDIDFSYENHQETFRTMMNALHQSFTENDKKFLISFFSLEPKWDLVNIPNIEKLPAVKWKIMNLEKMSKDDLKEQVEKIEIAFDKYKNISVKNVF